MLITFAGSLCCALSIGQFAGRLPSAGWAYTYNSRGLGPAAGFLTGWMMIFSYALFVPAGVGLTSAFGSQLVASTLHVTIAPVAAIGCLAVITLLIGLPLTYVYGGVATFGYLAGIGGLPVVLIYLTVNIAVIRAFRTEFRDEFRLGRHLLIPAAATAVFLFPLWGILFPGAYTLANLLPFISLGWLLIGAIAAGILRARRPVTFQALGRAVAPNLDKQLEPD